MPNEEFLKLIELVKTWVNGDAEYLWENTLKENAPDYVRAAFDDYKQKVKQFQAEGINV